MKPPRVSIGLPVWNGANYLREAIESILGQSYRDFELIISDNGSTDDTRQICSEYAERDPRVRFSYVEENRGASWNFNHVFKLARGEYFKWAAHDDSLDREFIERAVDVLDRHPEVVLCHTWVVDIDKHGEEILQKQSLCKTDTDEPHLRFRSLIEMKYTCEEVFGLVRSNVLRKTALIGNYSDSDRVLLGELGLYGRFFEIPEPMFLHRLHPKSSVKSFPHRQQRMQWFDPRLKRGWFFPHWRQFVELAKCVGRSELRFSHRCCCHVEVLRWAYHNRRWLKRDIEWYLGIYPYKNSGKTEDRSSVRAQDSSGPDANGSSPTTDSAGAAADHGEPDGVGRCGNQLETQRSVDSDF